MFRAFSAHHQELNDYSGRLWFYLNNNNKLKKLLHQFGDLFELNVILRCQNINAMWYDSFVQKHPHMKDGAF
jgi:hypothetical protein